MPIRVVCPCGQKIDAAERFSGRRVKCPTCGAPLTIPILDSDVESNVGTMEVLDMSDDPLQKESALSLAPLEEVTSSSHRVEDLKSEKDDSFSAPAAQAPASAYAPPTRVVEEDDDSPSIITVLGVVTFVVFCLVTLVGVVSAVLFWLPSQETFQGVARDTAEATKQKEAGVSDRTEVISTTETSEATMPDGSKTATGTAASSFSKDSSSPDKLRNIFGYDKDKRTQLSEYLQLKGYSRGHIGVLNIKILGRLNGVCRTFDLKPDANNYVVFPEKAFPEYRERFDSGQLFEDAKLGQELPDLLQDMRMDYEAGKLNEADRHLAFIIFSAFLLEKF